MEKNWQKYSFPKPQQHASLCGRNFGPAPSGAMTFAVNREGGDSDMTSNKTKHPLPHPAGRARKQGFQIRQ
jgi:hypothetical protein